MTAPRNTSWSAEKSAALYRLSGWAEGYFAINRKGHLDALPRGASASARVDLWQLTQDLRARGVTLPVLIRFTDILGHRLESLLQAFTDAARRQRFTGQHIAAYPIKVNQQSVVVEKILKQGKGRAALEVGSKSELLLAIALSKAGDLIICNGYKDQGYIDLAHLAEQLGQRIVLVVEKSSELDLILACWSVERGTFPTLGVRVRLASVASGKWQNTGGDRSKFGLYAGNLLRFVERLRALNQLDSLRLLHFHIGSQIPNIVHFRDALTEGARFYAELLQAGAPIQYLDIGGGLGVDYEGRGADTYCSMNYTMTDYADVAVSVVAALCHKEHLPHPAIVTEVGRAMTAHHAVLVTNVIETERFPGNVAPRAPQKTASPLVRSLYKAYIGIEKKNTRHAQEVVVRLHGTLKREFAQGKLSLSERARAEEIYYATCRKIIGFLDSSAASELADQLADKYFCNFSLFQSMPDAWGIDQIFPIMPLHRLAHNPNVRTRLQDLTCDSDGCVNHYVAGDGVSPSLPLHPIINGDEYLLGVFLLGAYQDTLGDMHNLFGDTASVDVTVTSENNYRISGLDHGSRVADLLQHVHLTRTRATRLLDKRVQAMKLPYRQRTSCRRTLLAVLDNVTYLD